MANFLLLYSGGSMPETEEEVAATMAAWGAWMGGLGEALVDGGNPAVPGGKSINAAGEVTDGSPFGAVSGYSVIKADSMDAAVEMASGCPVRDAGGSISVHETIEM